MPDNLYIFVNWACGAILCLILILRIWPECVVSRLVASEKMKSLRLTMLILILGVTALEFFYTTLYEPMFLRAQKDDPTFELHPDGQDGPKTPMKLPKSLDFAEYWLGSKDLAQGNNIYRDMAEYIYFKSKEHEAKGKPVSMSRYADYVPTSREGFDRLDRMAAENGIPVFPHFTYPPTWYLLFAPFTYLDWRDAHDLWLVANLIFAAASVVFILLAVGYRPNSGEEILALSTLILGYSPLIFSLKECQANSLVLLFVCLALYLASRGRTVAPGALIALGAATKIFPGILILYFLWKRKFKLAAWGFVFLVLIMLASVALGGWELNSWYFFNVAPTWAKNIRAFDMNQSVAGVIARSFVGGEGIEPILHLPRFGRALITLSQIVLFGILVWVTRGVSKRFDPRTWLEIGIVIVFYQLASTWVLIHHLQWLLVPFLLVWAMSFRGKSTLSPGLVSLFALSYLMTGVKYIYYREAFRAGAMALFASIKCFGMLVLFVTLAVAIRRMRNGVGGSTEAGPA
ncbi:MAG: DUF2029 domain-containing protein [Candidatus Coatesbacteria bacterium]|nr:DUF2029 domain-containing protein [Candidatus Coatesbacteria bacterium]